MKPGTKPKPTARKLLEGNPGKRPLNTREPVMPTTPEDFIEPPPELATDARGSAEWRRLAPLLQRSRTVTDADRASLIALCQQWSRYLEANGNVAVLGMVVRAPSGYPMPNPYIAIANKALGHCTKLWAELGLTPSSRTRVQTVADANVDAFAEFDEPYDAKTMH